MRCLQRAVPCMVLAVLLLPASSLRGQAGGAQRDVKENLDLPYEVLGGPGQEEEDAPEIVVLYGQSIEGDGFVFLGEGTT